ncbi:MAG: hypothetical protein QME66_02665 [Candidatus Eisenbacteria bacterium]|nr:hypothetical protein [Candidatus Eisenbacteria bacterium]
MRKANVFGPAAVFYVLLVAATLIVASSVQGTVFMEENWEAGGTLPNARWNVYSQCGSGAWPVIDCSHTYTPGCCLDPGGAGSGKAAGVIFATYGFDYVSGGLTIQADVYLVSTGYQYTEIYFGLLRVDDPTSPTSPWGCMVHPLEFSVLMCYQKGSANQRYISGAIYSDETEHNQGLPPKTGAYTNNAWNTAKIVIRPDQKVEFYNNGIRLWATTTATIDPDYNGMKFCLYGQSAGGPARADNFFIATELPTPAVPVTWGKLKSMFR